MKRKPLANENSEESNYRIKSENDKKDSMDRIREALGENTGSHASSGSYYRDIEKSDNKAEDIKTSEKKTSFGLKDAAKIAAADTIFKNTSMENYMKQPYSDMESAAGKQRLKKYNSDSSSVQKNNYKSQNAANSENENKEPVRDSLGSSVISLRKTSLDDDSEQNYRRSTEKTSIDEKEDGVKNFNENRNENNFAGTQKMQNQDSFRVDSGEKDKTSFGLKDAARIVAADTVFKDTSMEDYIKQPYSDMKSASKENIVSEIENQHGINQKSAENKSYDDYSAPKKKTAIKFSQSADKENSEPVPFNAYAGQGKNKKKTEEPAGERKIIEDYYE